MTILVGPKAGACECRRCIDEWDTANEVSNTIELGNARFIVCEFCGNKRCPHATDHRLDCTNSNAPGQKGSVYE
jgi:hypothetical protein